VQDRAALLVQLEQMSIKSDMEGTERRAQLRELKAELVEVTEARDALELQVERQQQELQRLRQQAHETAAHEATTTSQRLREMDQCTRDEVWCHVCTLYPLAINSGTPACVTIHVSSTHFCCS
jgi:regulator of replication initiation timing